jgi:hypothetical protein
LTGYCLYVAFIFSCLVGYACNADDDGSGEARKHLNRAQMFWSARLPLSGPRLHRAVIRVYDEAGNVIETHEHKGDFKEPEFFLASLCLSFLSFLYPPSSYNKKQQPCVRRDATCFG